MAKRVDLADLLHVEAERIREKLRAGRLYGYPIDMTDPDHVLVAAYAMGQTDWYTHHKQPEFP